MTKKSFLIILMLIGEILISSFIFAQSEESSFDVAEWIKRIDYAVTIESDSKPRFYFETVQPLYQSQDKLNTIFTHDRVSIYDRRPTFSLGFGYRRLLLNEQLLAGLNTFYDQSTLHNHYRSGVGVEAITKKLELRVNTYLGLSPKRLTEQTTTSDIYEKVADGFDAEFGGPIPYLPWCKLFGAYYHYDFEKSSDLEGYKIRSEIKPYKFITFNLETYDDNKGDAEYRLDTRFNLHFDDFSQKSIASAFKFANEAYPEADLKERTLDRVERNFNVQVEKWADTGSVSISIGRK